MFTSSNILMFALLPSGSHGDLFGYLGPEKVPIFVQGPQWGLLIFSNLGQTIAWKGCSSLNTALNCYLQVQISLTIMNKKCETCNTYFWTFHVTYSWRENFYEIDCFGQFYKNTHLGPYLSWPRSPLGPHLTQNCVPIGSPFWFFGSPLHFGAVYLVYQF